MLKNEKPEKSTKSTQISQFAKEQEILCDNLYKLNYISKYSQVKLGNNFNRMKKIESNEEVQKQKLKSIYENNLEKIKWKKIRAKTYQKHPLIKTMFPQYQK
jgi:hypothetical protein